MVGHGFVKILIFDVTTYVLWSTSGELAEPTFDLFDLFKWRLANDSTSLKN